MAEMRTAGVVLSNICKMREIVGILTGAVNVANFVLANRLLYRFPSFQIQMYIGTVIVLWFNVNPFERDTNSINAGHCSPCIIILSIRSNFAINSN